jgi:conjugal transfer pilus assembly protein TraB
MSTFRERVKGYVDALPPRTRQWGLATIIIAAGVCLLWAVFSSGSNDSAQRAAAAQAKSDVHPTNVDLMAPGAQVKDSEVWMGKAGKELDSYKNDKDEQRKLNRQMSDSQTEMARRLAELEQRLANRPPEQSAASSVPASAPAAARPSSPESALPKPSNLPPPPPPPVTYGRGAMPPGSPGGLGSPVDGPLSIPQPSLVRVTLAAPAKADGSKDAEKKPKDTLDTFLPVSFTRGQLLGGLDAPTGGQSQSNPHPVLIRLSDNSILPNRFRGEYRECFVVAAGYGDISSERAYLRTESLSCVRNNGEPLEVKIQGSVYGEDGKVGMRGRLVTKQGQILANALFAGVLSGIGQGISQANTTYSTSALGSVASTNSQADALRAGSASGVGKAMDRLAQYYIKLAEQTFPVIEVDGGREVDVVITKGVRIEGGGGDPSPQASSTSYPRIPDPADRFMKVNDDE